MPRIFLDNTKYTTMEVRGVIPKTHEIKKMNTYPIQNVMKLPKHSVNFKPPQIEVEEIED